MTLRREDVAAFAVAAIGRPLSHRELADVMQKCVAAGLRQGDEPYLLHLVMHREILTRLEPVTRPSIVAALKRLRGLIIATIMVTALAGYGLHASSYAAGYTQRDRMVARDLAWTATTAGAGARLLHDFGMVRRLIDCSYPGWSQVESFCIPGIDPNSRRMYGIQNRPLEVSE